MRISDWSTDVCSSDLPPLKGRGASVGYSAAMPALANISSPSASASAAPSSLAFAFLRLSKLVHTVFQSPRVAALLYSVARVSKKLACSTPLRSEEHTSELQSLMRISYAVFCLKKKKQIE